MPNCSLLPKLIPLLLAAVVGTANAQVVRLHDGHVTVTDRTIDGGEVLRRAIAGHAPPVLPAAALPPAARASTSGAPSSCSATPVAWHGQPLPAGESGTLSPLSFMRSATINAHGRLACAGQVEGSARNQGVFTADADGLQVIALGCGAAGGSGSTGTCGDPTPLGGTFGGFFLSTFATPDINDRGDVLFLADVVGGSARRGLFLYHAETGAIATIASGRRPFATRRYPRHAGRRQPQQRGHRGLPRGHRRP